MSRKGRSNLKVGIDARSLRMGASGVATYVSNLIEHIDCLEKFDVPRPGNNFLWNNVRVPLAARKKGWALFHAPSYTAPLWMPCPVVLSVHDISYLVKREWYPYRLGPLRKAYYRASLERADRILVPSRFSAEEVGRLFPSLAEKVRRVSLAVSGDFYPDAAGAERVRRLYQLPERFLLHVGDIHSRRNIPMISEAARTLRLRVVLVGTVRQEHGVDLASCRYLNQLPLDDLRGVYSAATVFAYASVYEGFGLPLLEAMACGLPVVAAACASVPEVCGEAAVLVEPCSDAIRQGIMEALERSDAYTAKGLEHAARFSWEKVASSTEAVYRELASA